MTRTALLLGLLMLASTGCREFQATLPNGTSIKSSSFACKLTIGSVSISTNGTASMSNYNLDQVSGVQAIGQIAIQGMIEGAKLAQQTNTTKQPVLLADH